MGYCSYFRNVVPTYCIHSRYLYLAGQGLNQAMEDAVELGHFLSQQGLLPDSLRQYEASRIPRVQEVMACEMVHRLPQFLRT